MFRRKPSRLALAALVAALGAPLAAQEMWLQIEARPSPAQAAARARAYAERLDGVQSFALDGSRWNAVVLGPFDAAEIAGRRRALLARRAVPADSFATDGARFGQRLYPPDGAPAEAARTSTASAAPDRTAGETPAEARRAERRLSRAERERLQRALAWAGRYDAAIDGAFGRGTRRAMAAWQRAEDHEPTGVLTTAQRRDLLAAYDAVLDGLGLAPVADEVAGVTLAMPTARVALAGREPPFARYADPEGGPAEVLLISMSGGPAELRGLFEVMQTLEIVPPAGARALGPTSFTLTGRDGEIVSETRALVTDGAVKGFTLVWPAGDEARRRRLVSEMQASFATDPGEVMPDTLGPPGEDQSVDLLAGLEIRRPDVNRSGFYVGRQGHVLTTADAVQGCDRVTLDQEIEARVAARDEAAGLALLRPLPPLAPRSHARFLAGVPRLRSEVVLAGFSYDGALGLPSLTYGALAAMRGLDGEEELRRYDLATRPGDAGGPVLDASGAVLGLLASPADGPRRLPEGVAFAIDVETITAFLEAAGLTPDTADLGGTLPRGRLEDRAADMTVHVGCWR